MYLAKVTGNLVSTIKTPSHYGHKLMMVEAIDLDGKPYGARKIAIDAADAGVGDTVLVNVDGGAALMIFNDKELISNSVICAVVDHFDVVN